MSKAPPNQKKVPLARAVPHLPLLELDEDSTRADLDQRPSTLFQCRRRDGSLDWQLYIAYRNQQSEKADELWDEDWDDWDEDHQEEDDEEEPKKKRAKPTKKHLLSKGMNERGEVVDLQPIETSWYIMYVLPRERTPEELTKFRLRFRLPHPQFLELIDKVRNNQQAFKSHLGSSASSKAPHPLELKILGALRYLGRGWTFDDLEEATAISAGTHCRFFKDFITWGSTTLFQEYVVEPADDQSTASKHQHEFALAGCHGAIGSTDAVHIVLERTPSALINQHHSWKTRFTARTYNVTVNHRRRILATTRGHPASWNDKTVVLFDNFVRGIHDGKKLSNLQFTLFEKNPSGKVVEQKYQGCWLLADNGYLNWSTTMPPLKRSNDRREIRWSEWIESMRKDVECTFGILKGRFRILKSGICLQ
jgi:hypothetical protein